MLEPCGPIDSKTSDLAASRRKELLEWITIALFVIYILVDHARTRMRVKRGGGLQRLALDDSLEDGAGPELDLVELGATSPSRSASTWP